MKKNQHGGDIYSYYEKYGKYPIDFSSSLNPLGAPLYVTNTFVSSYKFCFSYPPFDYKLLIEKIAAYESVGSENICVTNGASELIQFLPLIFKFKNSLICAPSFSQYEKTLKKTNIYKHLLKEENKFKLDNSFLNEIKNKDVVIIANPDNPVGNIISFGLIKDIINECKKEGAFLIIDECFMDLSTEKESAVSLIYEYDKLIIIKAFTKTYAFAGLRLGYGIACKEIIEKINSNLVEWRINVPAYMCGISALNDSTFLENSLKYIEKERKYLIDNLLSFNFKIYGSKANFIFFYAEINNLKEMLEKKDILIRDCSNYFGLSKNYYRIAVKKHEDNVKLINAVKDIIYG